MDDLQGDDEVDGLSLPQQRFFAVPLPPPGPEWRELGLDQLIRFFAHPCRYLLRERLGLVLPQGDEELSDEEPFRVDRRAGWMLAQRLLPRLLAGDSVHAVTAAARASLDYPPGPLGESELEQDLAELTAYALPLQPALAAPLLPPVQGTLEIAVDGEPWRLSGAFTDLRAEGRIVYRYAKTKARDYLEAWIAHLFLNALASVDVLARTTCHYRDGAFVLLPLPDAQAQLANLLGLYRDGLCAPLAFFPRAALALVRRDGNLSAARQAWRGKRQQEGESDDPAYALALRGIENPLDESFERCARLVFTPLLEHIEDSRPQ